MRHESDQPTKCVLIVDDDALVLDMLAEALSYHGYGVVTAPSAEAALGLLRENPYDLVLCDIYLSGMDGLGFTRAVCRIHPQMPVVVMTAFGDVVAGRLALEAGASDFVTKPLELSKLPIAIENNLQRKIIEARRLSGERADVLFKAIKALAAAIDAKSHYTGCHSARMAELCVAVGVEMGLNEERLNTLELAAHIHDVGKIGTPDAVLMKPGKLSEEEWNDILKHPAMGADFLAGIDELAEVADIVRHHHEHLDGSGYPDGLKADAIPNLARILSVADAFEAMTSDRPYRRAITSSVAIQELRSNAGTQFDPNVVEALAIVIGRQADEGTKRAA
ncbi:MAG: response regulator [Armatimonadetes bacterium]|nr:response regulator [Armatimonadota bacterium]